MIKFWNNLSPKAKKTIIGTIIALIILSYVNKNWHKIMYKLRPLNINFEDGEQANISAARKVQLEGLAKSIFTDIEETPWTGHDYTPYESALALSDNELAYLSKFYMKQLSVGKSLYQDMDTQWYMTGSGVTGKLMARLAAIGLA